MAAAQTCLSGSGFLYLCPTQSLEVATYTQLSDQYYVYTYILALLFMMKRIHKHLKTSKVKRDNLTRIIKHIYFCIFVFRIFAIILIYCHVDFLFRYVNKRCDIWCPLTPAPSRVPEATPRRPEARPGDRPLCGGRNNTRRRRRSARAFTFDIHFITHRMPNTFVQSGVYTRRQVRLSSELTVGWHTLVRSVRATSLV